MNDRNPGIRSRKVVAALVFAALIPLGAWSWSALAVQSLTLAQQDIALGTSTTATIRLDQIPSKSVSATITSSNTAVATVPASISFGIKISSRSVSVQSAGTPGCSQISAQVTGSAAKSAIVAVLPPPRQSGAPDVRLASSATVGGATVQGTVSLVGVPGTVSVRLASSNTSVATVPATVNVTSTLTEAGPVGSATFPISTAPVGVTQCPLISATYNGKTTAALLKIHSISG